MVFLPFSTKAETITPLETKAKHAILLDATTGSVLFAKDAEAQMPPSSMSKVLTMYLVFEALKDGRLKLTDTLPVSTHAWEQTGSRMFLKVGEQAKVEDLIRGVVVQSGNDASMVFAEKLGGSEEGFAALMNTRAKDLGLTESHFVNPTGLPHPEHLTSARDLAKLGMAILRDFPEHYHYFKELEFTYNNIKQGNRNPLLYRSIGVDGLKTGHTDAAGYGLMASALRDVQRLLLVVNGLENMQARADESAKILAWGYHEFGCYPLLKQGGKLGEAKVWMGLDETVPFVVGQPVTLSLPRSARGGLRATLLYAEPLRAPVVKGQLVGHIVLAIPGQKDLEIPLLASTDVVRKGLWARMLTNARFLLGKVS